MEEKKKISLDKYVLLSEEVLVKKKKIIKWRGFLDN